MKDSKSMDQKAFMDKKSSFEKELKKKRLPKDILSKEEFVKQMLKKSNFNTLEEAYENIGFGSVSPLKVV